MATHLITIQGPTNCPQPHDHKHHEKCYVAAAVLAMAILMACQAPNNTSDRKRSKEFLEGCKSMFHDLNKTGKMVDRSTGDIKIDEELWLAGSDSNRRTVANAMMNCEDAFAIYGMYSGKKLATMSPIGLVSITYKEV